MHFKPSKALIEKMIIVAIDEIDFNKASNIIDNLDSSKCMIKIGSVAFNSLGHKVIDYAAQKGFDIFLDLKLHDIPNTVKKSIEGLSFIAYKNAYRPYIWWKRYDESCNGSCLRNRYKSFWSNSFDKSQ